MSDVHTHHTHAATRRFDTHRPGKILYLIHCVLLQRLTQLLVFSRWATQVAALLILLLTCLSS